jgi:hypothetical protein
MNRELSSDYRIQELLIALNEGILDVEFVESRIRQCAGESIELVHYSDGEYGIISSEF